MLSSRPDHDQPGIALDCGVSNMNVALYNARALQDLPFLPEAEVAIEALNDEISLFRAKLIDDVMKIIELPIGWRLSELNIVF